MPTMKAIFFLGKDRFEVRETAVPQIGENEALIKVKYAGICGTDLSIIAGTHPRAKPPLIMGHEFSGEICEISPLQDGLKTGDRVVAEPLISCGGCFTCRSGLFHVCEKLELYGIDKPGAFAQFVKIPTEKIFKIPGGIEYDIASLSEPTAVAIHAVRSSGLKTGDIVCVQGGGPIGLLTAIVARESGAKEVLICEKDAFRLKTAEGFGLTAIDLNTADPLEMVWSASKERGADLVFEAAGTTDSIELSPRLCRVRGEVVAVAMPKVPVPYDIFLLTSKEITVKGIRVYTSFDFERAIEFMSGSGLDFSPLLSPPFLFKDAKVAFEKAAQAKGVMKVLLKPED